MDIYIGEEQIEYETDGDIYSFSIPEGCEETSVKVVASDSAGNTYERVLNDLIPVKAAGHAKNTNMPLILAAAAGIVLAVIIAVRRFRKKSGKEII